MAAQVAYGVERLLMSLKRRAEIPLGRQCCG